MSNNTGLYAYGGQMSTITLHKKRPPFPFRDFDRIAPYFPAAYRYFPQTIGGVFGRILKKSLHFAFNWSILV